MARKSEQLKMKAEKPTKKASKKVVEKPTKKASKKVVEKPTKKASKKALHGKAFIQLKRDAKTANKVGNWKVEDMREAAYNPRVISEKELSALETSIKQFGDLSGVVLNRFTGNLISGHQRMKTIKHEKNKVVTKKVTDAYGTVEEGHILVKTVKGVIRIPLRIVDWPESKAELAANIAANAHGGSFEHNMLAKMVSDLSVDEEFDINVTGLDIVTLKSLGHLTLGKERAAKIAGESDAAFPEYDSASFKGDLEHECPRCSFKFGDKS